MGLFRSESPVIVKERFLDKFEMAVLMWSRQLNTHRLDKGLENREFRGKVFVGLLIETYHYVAAAAKHSATAITYCNDKWWLGLQKAL